MGRGEERRGGGGLLGALTRLYRYNESRRDENLFQFHSVIKLALQLSRQVDMAKKCEVCNEQDSKYKCPKCRTSYCSVVCYKLHKDSSCERACKELSERAAEKGGSGKQNQVGGYAPDDDASVDEGYRIQQVQLDRMVESEKVQEWLREPRIREIIELIDAADDREKALDGALETNKEFSDFVDQLTSVINPEGAPM